ncbi:hypothetical protein HanRHA438_Chr04g0173271 [Helianthus annuus]|uniref:Uncharacterized protein n=1 Tax=Helianthus annuus TaxID=4232 RepID=A0A9K3J6Z1_HELAN|nr:hypothetical protein HanXRQr2_Chr04g0163271 [Helianthus annuus]KAJ0580872.1 hypothetical protein HanHA300_Chr04g0134321 [Helianthus annuus]KAJ0588590.1 hypothetical protein HanIR_Chr04g0176361 [Helianthus annuus]KAJ0757491.1 hypothetical protein HanLR1_Chr04g0139301 [Helianthus annuus]KAJ0761181.1 hypothetical protein HanOQP8_Chr04g0146741 [Helianthus annuus]
MFDYCNYRLPLTKFLVYLLLFHQVHLSQMNPFGLAKVWHFELSCCGLGSNPDLDVCRAFYRLNRTGDWYTVEVRNKSNSCFSWIASSMKDWKDRFFLVDDHCVPSEMAWRPRKSSLPRPLPDGFQYNKTLYASLIKEAGRIQKLPEQILVMGKINTLWLEPGYYPTIRWNGEGQLCFLLGLMGLKDALRLKSFNSNKFGIWATKTKEGDRLYLDQVKKIYIRFRTQLLLVIKVVLVQRHWSKHLMFLHFVLFRWWPVTRGWRLVRAVFRFLKKGVRRLLSMVPSIYLLRTKIR